MCVNSEYDEDVFASAFRMKPEKFVRTGLPRNDDLFLHRDDSSEAWKRKLGLPLDKKLILYAPTWRDTLDGGESYQIAPPVDVAKWEKRLGEKYILGFRMHPITQKSIGVKFDAFCRDYSRYQPLNDLLLATDMLITDYSSIAFDYSVLGRPILCFGYDLAEYSRARGLYLNPAETFPFGVQRSEGELLDAIEAAETWNAARKRSLELAENYNTFGGNATDECIRLLFGDGALA